MTTFEKRSAGTNYDERDSHQQHAGLPTGGNVMSTWTVAFYDYAEQVLKAQRQFAHSILDAAAPMLNVARDVMPPDASGTERVNTQMDARSDQGHDGSNRSWKNERYNDDDTAEYNKRSVDNNTSDDYTSDASGTERANTQAEESAETQAPRRRERL